MTDNSYVEITGKIAAPSQGRKLYWKGGQAQAIYFTLFHDSGHGYGPISVVVKNRHEIREIDDYPPTVGSLVRIKGVMSYQRNRWVIVIPSGAHHNDAITVIKREPMPGLGIDIDKGGAQ